MKKLSLIAAMGLNRVIGDGLRIPWHLPADFQHFKETTMGHPLIMGRKTFDSLPGVLPGRPHIVLSRDSSYEKRGVTVVDSVEHALEAAYALDDTPFVIGGAQIYKEFLDRDLVTRMYLTFVDGSFEGDVYFPEITNWEDWDLYNSRHYPLDEYHRELTENENLHAFTIDEYRWMGN